MNKIALLLSVLLLTPACSYITEPRPFGMTAGLVDGAPPGPPSFRYGWKDGCESGMAAYGSLHYKIAYDYVYDSTAINDHDYQEAWDLGFRHCRWYTSSWVS